MSIISSSAQGSLFPVIFQYDCEVDGINVNNTNISEVCLRTDQVARGKGNYFVAYMSKPYCSNYTGPFQKPIPVENKRYDTKISLDKMFSFINKRIKNGGLAVLMGYNVKGWDEPVLRSNCARFHVVQPLDRLKFFDIAEVAHHLGFPMGTTQQQLEVALDIKDLPANRHRALADVIVVKQIWKRMIKEIEGNANRLSQINTALVSNNAESEVAKILLEYDPTLAASEERVARIRDTKESEKIVRLPVTVLYDTETTGLLPKERQHYDTAIRVVEIGAKIVSPYSGSEYDENFQAFVNPGIPIPEGATRIHGITDEHVVGQPDMAEAWGSFELWVKASNTYKRMMSESENKDIEPCIVLTGYNNMHYDNVLVIEENLRAGVDIKRQLDKKVKKTYDAMMLMSTWYTGEPSKPPSNKLQDHARFLGIPEADAHRALGDVKTLDQVFRKICGPINPSLVIAEALNFPDEPGKSAKAIIKEALWFIELVIKNAGSAKVGVESVLGRINSIMPSGKLVKDHIKESLDLIIDVDANSRISAKARIEEVLDLVDEEVSGSIKKFLELIDTEIGPEKAVKDAVQVYENNRNSSSSSKGTLVSRKRKAETEEGPVTQEFLLDSQDLTGKQTVCI